MQQFTNNRKKEKRDIYDSPQKMLKSFREMSQIQSWDGHKSIRDMKMFLLIFLKLVWAQAGEQ